MADSDDGLFGMIVRTDRNETLGTCCACHKNTVHMFYASKKKYSENVMERSQKFSFSQRIFRTILTHVPKYSHKNTFSRA